MTASPYASTEPYSTALAQSLMTLASIAYAGDPPSIDDPPPPLSAIKSAICKQLQNTGYATGGNWSLVWGPVRASTYDNLVFVAANEDASQTAIVIRGTVMQARSWWEDVPDGQAAFDPNNFLAGKISTHFQAGANELVSTADPDAGTTLYQYLQGAVANAGTSLYVTGHSQGGGLTSVLLGMITNQMGGWSPASGVTAQGYGFASPTAGDPAFAQWIDAYTSCYLVANPLDLVPFGYNRILNLIWDEVPTKPDAAIDAALVAAQAEVDAVGGWGQPSGGITLGKVQLPASISYTAQVGDQHNHNSYLWLLGATQTDIGSKSVLPNYASSAPPPTLNKG